MKKILKKGILILGAIHCGLVQAGFEWGSGCEPGAGQFEQQILYYDGDFERASTVGVIPVGIKNVTITLKSSKDVDIRLYDQNGKAIVHWPTGLLNGYSKQSIKYNGVTIEYSGYNGDGKNYGNEYIKIIGGTSNAFTMKAFGYVAGFATVNYSWEGKTDCGLTGEGSFKQYIPSYFGNLESVVTVGEIPKGLTNVFIGLSSAKDVDIRLYAENGSPVVHWPSGLIASSFPSKVVHDGVTIEYSGYNGDGKYLGHEYIKISGKTNQKYTMKAFGYVGGEATVDYSWGKFSIFTGISGGSVNTLWDGSNSVARYFGSAGVAQLLSDAKVDCVACIPNDMSSLKMISANNNSGGIVAIAYNAAKTVMSRVVYSRSGNTDILRADIEVFYKANPAAKIFIAGHSTGGGDVQNLVHKLKALGIPVELSAHIDSVEILSGDAGIPSNVKRAMGFYQDEGTWLTRGEANLKALDSDKSIVTNMKISSPVGPSDPKADNNAYHKNMDNDERVWSTILSFFKLKR